MNRGQDHTHSEWELKIFFCNHNIEVGDHEFGIGMLRDQDGCNSPLSNNRYHWKLYLEVGSLFQHWHTPQRFLLVVAIRDFEMCSSQFGGLVIKYLNAMFIVPDNPSPNDIAKSMLPSSIIRIPSPLSRSFLPSFKALPLPSRAPKPPQTSSNP